MSEAERLRNALLRIAAVTRWDVDSSGDWWDTENTDGAHMRAEDVFDIVTEALTPKPAPPYDPDPEGRGH